MGANAIVATPSSVALARVVRGLTQQELAAQTGISQAYLSKIEKGAVELTGDRLRAVADALGYPVEFFHTDPDAAPAPTACAFPRKRNSLPTSAEKRIRATLEITRLQVEPLLDDSAPAVTLPRRPADDDGWTTGAMMAMQVREQAGIPTGPIGDLVALLESFGVVVIVRELGNRRIDAIGQWPDGHRPLMLINSTTGADRRRFTLAHELGHAVLHTVPQPDQESEADEFAAELLLPAAQGRELFTNSLDLATAAALKPVWGMSMAAIVRRAYYLDRISEYRYRQLNIELSAAGYATREPATLTAEVPTTLTAAIARHRGRGQSDADLAQLAHMTENELTAVYLEAA
ncbi:MAG: helix-turn-helix domain-containing protein [Jatrophihabitans sp.]